MVATSKFSIGIDLGTTNSALAYTEFKKSEQDVAGVNILEIPQITDPGICETKKLLPSFVYLPAKGELPAGSLKLPWGQEKTFCVGEFAKKQGALVPTHLVTSAKSWLSNQNSERRDKNLPFKAGEDVQKISALEASSLYLKHLQEAWNLQFAKKDEDSRLENQSIVLTVPASFDALARELTLEAAKEVGFKKVTLLEEPQAAFYAWLESQKTNWRDLVEEGDVILVVDVGGGTSDFTLISVESDQGNLTLNRLAVGQHILLGGDNMDLALAYGVSAQLAAKGTKLDITQMVALSHACRAGKEAMLSDPKLESWPITLLGKGSKVISGTIKTLMERKTLEAILMDGFFPMVSAEEQPAQASGYGFQEIGLPFASDPAITRHLAHFLNQHKESINSKKNKKVSPGITGVLFNGGVFKSGLLRNRILLCLEKWFSHPIKTLENQDLDLAVAVGASSFGLVKQGKGIRIKGGAPRTYYIGIETSGPAIPGFSRPLKALCVVPFGMEEGSELEIPNQEFGLVVGQTARFRFFSSTSRKEDPIGSILEEWGEEVQECNPLEVSLEASGKSSGITPVFLQSKISDIGILELWCIAKNSKQRWKLEFQVRAPKVQ